MKLSWPIKVFFITFLLAAAFSGATNLVANVNIIALSIILVLVIFIGIIFDMIGVAALTLNLELWCGIISGSFGAILAISIAENTSLSLVISSIIVTAFISALTVGGKSYGKQRAIKNADKIIYRVARIKKMLSIK